MRHSEEVLEVKRNAQGIKAKKTREGIVGAFEDAGFGKWDPERGFGKWQEKSLGLSVFEHLANELETRRKHEEAKMRKLATFLAGRCVLSLF